MISLIPPIHEVLLVLLPKNESHILSYCFQFHCLNQAFIVSLLDCFLTLPSYSLEQGSINFNLQPCHLIFLKNVLLKLQPHPLNYILYMVAGALKWCSWVDATKTVCPTSLNFWLSDPLRKHFVTPFSRCNSVNSCLLQSKAQSFFKAHHNWSHTCPFSLMYSCSPLMLCLFFLSFRASSHAIFFIKSLSSFSLPRQLQDRKSVV